MVTSPFSLRQTTPSTKTLWIRYNIPLVIQALFDLGIKLWQNRNDYVFGPTPAEQAQKHEEQLNRRLTDTFNDKDLLSSDDAKLLFTITLPELLKLPIARRQNWLNTYLSCVKTPSLINSQARSSTAIHPFFQQPPSKRPPPVPNIQPTTSSSQIRSRTPTVREPEPYCPQLVTV